MSEKIKLSISPAVAAYVRPGTSIETRLGGCGASESLEPFDRVTLLFCLSKDPEQSIRAVALTYLQKLPEDVVGDYASSEKALPLVLDFVSGRRGVSVPIPPPEAPSEPFQMNREDPLLPMQSENSETGSEDSDVDDEEPIDEEGEQFLSKFKIAQMMGIGEKIKMALTGDKEWRSILVKDSNKLVSGSVVKNPRITESEILQLIKSGIQNDEIMRLICSNKEWIKSYKVRKSLIENNRTPVQNSMRYLATMGEKDLAGFAKSKNISSVVSTMAKRLILNKKK